MKRNMGTGDRALRAFVLAPAAALGAVMETGGWSIALWCIAGLLLVTAASGICLLYRPLGIDTRRSNQDSTTPPRGVTTS